MKQQLTQDVECPQCHAALELETAPQSLRITSIRISTEDAFRLGLQGMLIIILASAVIGAVVAIVAAIL